MSSEDLAEKLYLNAREKPFFARQAMLGAMRSLARKVEANKEPFTVQQSKRSGPYPIEFWLEERA